LNKKTFATGITFLFIISTITPIAIGYKATNYDYEILTQGELIQSIDNPFESDWPMYQHDALNTGYSQTSFPDSFNKLWFKSYMKDLNINMVSPFASPVTSNGNIYIPGDTPDLRYEVLCVLNQSNGSLIWKKVMPINPNATGGFHSYRSPAIYKGKIFTTLGCFPTFKGKSKIIAYDENTGDTLWEKLYFGLSYYSSVTVADDKIFICGHLSFCPISLLYVFDANNGDLLWRKIFRGYIETTPVVYDNKVIVVSGRVSGAILLGYYPKFSGKSRVFAFDIDNGEKIWMNKIWGHLVQCSPTASGGKLFVPSTIMLTHFLGISRLSTLDLDTGEEIWHRNVIQERGGGWPSSISTPSVAYDKVFVTDTKSWLHVWDQETGELIWEKEIIPDDPSLSSGVFVSPVIIDGKVIVGASANSGFSYNELFMFNESNGEYIWNLKFYGESYAPFVVSNEMLFVLNVDGIYAFG